MKHNIRQRVINEYGLPVTKIESVTGELGSGVFDKNGKEIFEGDIVKASIDDTDYVVGKILIDVFDFGLKEGATVHGGICHFGSKALEVIGHADD